MDTTIRCITKKYTGRGDVDEDTDELSLSPKSGRNESRKSKGMSSVKVVTMCALGNTILLMSVWLRLLKECVVRVKQSTHGRGKILTGIVGSKET